MQREGRARQGCLKRVCPKFRTDAKPKKHTQTLTLRKASGIEVLSNSIPTVTARNSFRIVKAGLSEYCTASEKIVSAVPPPLFRGRAWMPEVERPKFRKDAKQAERSLKGKGVGARRGIVRFWEDWCGARGGVTIPPS